MEKIKILFITIVSLFIFSITTFGYATKDTNNWVHVTDEEDIAVSDNKILVRFSDTQFEFVGGWLNLKDNWYYIQNGQPVANTWITDNGQQYYLDNNGIWIEDAEPDILPSPSGNPLLNGGPNLSGSIQPVIPFSTIQELEPVNGTDNFDYFGIVMNGKVENFVGNTAFIGNVDSTLEFEDLLKKALYNGAQCWVDWIERLKEQLHIETRKFQKKDTMDVYTLEATARLQRNENIKRNMLLEWMELIIRASGIFLIIYGIIVVICGVIDELGLMNKYMTSMVTGGKINQDNPTVFVGSPRAFRYMYLCTSALIILLGIICLSPSLRQWIVNIFLTVINTIKGMFENVSTEAAKTLQ